MNNGCLRPFRDQLRVGDWMDQQLQCATRPVAGAIRGGAAL